MATLILVFKKIESEDKTKYDTFYSNSKAGVFTNESNIDDIFQSIYTTIISNIQKSLGKGSGWIIDSVIDHTISISKYNPLTGSSYIELPKELNYLRKEFINVQSFEDNECFKWRLVRYLIPADCNPARITKADKDFVKKLDFKGIKFPIKVSNIQKIEKTNSISISVFGYENKEKHPVYVLKKCCEEKNVNLLLIGEKGKRHYFLI